MVTEVFEKLKHSFPNINANPLTVDEALNAIDSFIKCGGAKHA
jgi:hypothetical protein